MSTPKSDNKPPRQPKDPEAQALIRQHIDQGEMTRAQTWLAPTSRLSAQAVPGIDPVFVAIDIEDFEWNHKLITEVGITTLDTRHLQGLCLDNKIAAWRAQIHTRHLIVREYNHPKFVNKRFCHGCPYDFDFGQSEVVSLNKVKSRLTGICQKATWEHGQYRPMILVGHALIGDIHSLAKLGVGTSLIPGHQQLESSPY